MVIKITLYRINFFNSSFLSIVFVLLSIMFRFIQMAINLCTPSVLSIFFDLVCILVKADEFSSQSADVHEKLVILMQLGWAIHLLLCLSIIHQGNNIQQILLYWVAHTIMYMYGTLPSLPKLFSDQVWTSYIYLKYIVFVASDISVTFKLIPLYFGSNKLVVVWIWCSQFFSFIQLWIALFIF